MMHTFITNSIPRQVDVVLVVIYEFNVRNKSHQIFVLSLLISQRITKWGMAHEIPSKFGRFPTVLNVKYPVA